MSERPPANEQEWMTHVLNIHGTPFEHLCQYHLRQSSDWVFKSSRYPVEFPPSYSPLVSQTENSELDLWGSCTPPGLKIELLVECKKNNPDYTDWVFFPTQNPAPVYPFLRALEYRPLHSSTGPPWRSQREIAYLDPPPGCAIADEGRETKGKYQERWGEIQQNQNEKKKRELTKTSNTAITDAANQIALATQALLLQERRNRDASAMEQAQVSQMPSWLHVFLPLIVTTAHLWTCHYPAEKVDIATGEIPLNEVRYQPHKYLFFTYALPPLLQFHPDDHRGEYRSDAAWEELARFSILVVQSDAFPALLDYLSKMTKGENRRLTLPTLS